MCNRVHLHIVFVLLYSVCRSVNVLSCVDIIQSLMYVLRVIILDITERHGESAQEKARDDTNSLSEITSEKKRRNKTGITGCGLVVAGYVQPATSIDRLHLALMSRIGSRETKYHQAN